MGESKTFKCKDCDFELTDDFLLFYYDCDSKETKSYMLLFSTVDIDQGSKIRGNVLKSYCDNCKRFVDTYNIYDDELDGYDENQVMALVNDGIFKSFEPHYEYLNKENLQLIKRGNNLYCYLTDFHSFSHRVSISDFSSERNAIKACLEEGRSKLQDEIEKERKISENELKKIYNVEYQFGIKDNDYILCPKCKKQIPIRITENMPCPKCGGKLEVTNWLLLD